MMVCIMSKAKVLIETKNIGELSQFLKDLHEAIERAKQELERTGSPGVFMDGWPSIVRGLISVVDQSIKITGPASKIPMMDPMSLLLEGMECSSPKRTRKKVSKAVESTKVQIKSDRKKKT